MGLDLYSQIEQYLDFDEEVQRLHKEFLKLVAKCDPQTALDIGCGQGAFLQNLVLNKVDALGIDLSAEQIKICQAKGLNAKVCNLNEIKEKFDVATAIFDVINYIPTNELENFFKSVHSVLNDSGYFIFDINTLFGFEDVAQGSLNINLDNKFIAIDAFFEDSILTTDLTLFTQNSNKTFSKQNDSIIQYYHSTKKIEEVAKNSLFTIEKVIEVELHNFGKSDKNIFVLKKSH